MNRSDVLSRRSFFKAAPLVAFSSLLGAQAPPEKGAHAMHAGPPSADPALARALRAHAGAMRGFDPMRFLTSFEWGKATPLGGGRMLREYTLRAQDVEVEVAPGVPFRAWTYNGTVPGPTLRCREGDRLRVRLVNESLSEHTIHFHGIHPAGMDGVGPDVLPGEELTYEFDAEPAGLHPYHCHVAPVPLHMNRGLFGCMIVDPPTPLPPAKELVMVMHGWDVDFDGKNELYACNGPVNFYRDNPIPVKVGERVRIYLSNLLEYDLINSFHLHANVFDLYRTGLERAPNAVTDIVTLSQAERCILEFSYRFPGRYMFHAHQNTFADLGWMGHFEVT